MKHYIKKEIPAKPATTEEVFDKVTCDLCGNDIIEDQYKVDEVQVKHRTGDEYPEGGYGDEVSVDMCGDCFDKKLLPWLREQGVEPKPEEWSW